MTIYLPIAARSLADFSGTQRAGPCRTWGQFNKSYQGTRNGWVRLPDPVSHRLVPNNWTLSRIRTVNPRTRLSVRKGWPS